MSIEEYKPKSTLVVPQHPVTRARNIRLYRCPQSSEFGGLPVEQMDKLVKDHGQHQSTGDGEPERRFMATGWRKAFCQPQGPFTRTASWCSRISISPTLDDPGLQAKRAGRPQLERDVHNGAQGLKIFKNFRHGI